MRPPQDPYSRERVGDDTRIPRWVKVVGVVALLVVVLAGVLMFALGGNGGHTPRRHGGAGGDTAPAGVIQDGGVTPPDAGHRRPDHG